MKVTIESTAQIVDVAMRGEDMPIDPARFEHLTQGRVWVGKTESGIPVQLLVLRVAVPSAERQEEFERELMAQHAPRPETAAFALRLVL